jgi:hypothetical protein
LQESNYAKWHELFIIALDRYDLTTLVLSLVLTTADATPLNTSPTSDWAWDDYMMTPKSIGSL